MRSLSILALLLVLASCQADREPKEAESAKRMPMNGDMMDRTMPDWMMSSGMDSQMMQDMPVIHSLLSHHAEIRRKVEDLPNGVRTVTTSQDPEVAKLIRAHVWQMKARMKEGRPIRQMDPVFRELFRHHKNVRLAPKEVPGGIQVTETSDDPQVVLLIRQHAHQAVSGFVRYGMPRAMQPTELPVGYSAR